MSTNGRRTTKRDIVVDNYNGFDIIRVKVTEHEYSHVLHKYFDWGKTETHFDFCKTGDFKKPSMHYGVWAESIGKCKECIDNFIKDDCLYFTEGERQKYVYAPNRKNDWSFSYDSIMRLMKQHQKADKRIKILLEDRLTDANFHSHSSLLSEGKYKEFEELAAKELTIRDKFEIITESKRKGIKDPKKLLDGLKKVLDDYFNAHGVDTSVKVKYVENW